MNFFVVGDVHGRFDLLQKILTIWKERYVEHRLVFLGDLVDRGPDSFEVVETVKTLTLKNGAIALMGNHEDMMLSYWHGKFADHYDVWLDNGGRKTIRSYGKSTKNYGTTGFFEEFSKHHARWIESLPLNYEDDKVWFSHAPIPAEEYGGKDKDFRTNRWMNLWTNKYSIMSATGKSVNDETINRDLGKTAVYGHLHALSADILVPRVFRLPNSTVIHADTGCGCAEYGPLSGVVIEDGEYKGFVSVNSTDGGK